MSNRPLNRREFSRLSAASLVSAPAMLAMPLGGIGSKRASRGTDGQISRRPHCAGDRPGFRRSRKGKTSSGCRGRSDANGPFARDDADRHGGDLRLRGIHRPRDRWSARPRVPGLQGLANHVAGDGSYAPARGVSSVSGLIISTSICCTGQTGSPIPTLWPRLKVCARREKFAPGACPTSGSATWRACSVFRKAIAARPINSLQPR